MVKVRLTLWFYSIITIAQALSDAFPHEMMAFYAGYKIEYALVPAANRRIATGCE